MCVDDDVMREAVSDAVGLTPKAYCRVPRLQRALPLVVGARATLACAAAGAGYSDQAHLTREFAAVAGLSPSRYRALVAAPGNHVPRAHGGKKRSRPSPRHAPPSPP